MFTVRIKVTSLNSSILQIANYLHLGTNIQPEARKGVARISDKDAKISAKDINVHRLHTMFTRSVCLLNARPCLNNLSIYLSQFVKELVRSAEN